MYYKRFQIWCGQLNGVNKIRVRKNVPIPREEPLVNKLLSFHTASVHHCGLRNISVKNVFVSARCLID